MKLLKALKDKCLSISTAQLMVLLVMTTLTSCESCNNQGKGTEENNLILAVKEKIIGDELGELEIKNEGERPANLGVCKLAISYTEQGGAGSKLVNKATGQAIENNASIALKEFFNLSDGEEELAAGAAKKATFEVQPGTGVTSLRISFKLLNTADEQIGETKEVTWEKASVELKFKNLPTEVYGEETVTFRLESRTNKELDLSKVSIAYKREKGTKAVVSSGGTTSATGTLAALTGKLAAGSSSLPTESGAISFELDSKGENSSFEFTLFYDGVELEKHTINVHSIDLRFKDLPTEIYGKEKVTFRLSTGGKQKIEASRIKINFKRADTGTKAVIKSGGKTVSTGELALGIADIDPPASQESGDISFELDGQGESTSFEFSLSYDGNVLETKQIKVNLLGLKFKSFPASVVGKETVTFYLENRTNKELDLSKVSIAYTREKGKRAVISSDSTTSSTGTLAALTDKLAAGSSSLPTESGAISFELDPQGDKSASFKFILTYEGVESDEHTINVHPVNLDFKDLPERIIGKQKITFHLVTVGKKKIEKDQVEIAFARETGTYAVIKTDSIAAGSDNGKLDLSKLVDIDPNTKQESEAISFELDPQRDKSASFKFSLWYEGIELTTRTIHVHPVDLSFGSLPTEVYGKETVTFQLENKTNKEVEIGKVKIRFERATGATQAEVTGKGPSGYLDLTRLTNISASSSSGPGKSGAISFELDSQGEDTSFEFTLIYDGDTLETKQIAVHPIALSFAGLPTEVYGKDTVTFQLENKTNKEVDLSKVSIAYTTEKGKKAVISSGSKTSATGTLAALTGKLAAGSSSGPSKSGDISLELDSQGEEAKFKLSLIYDGDTLETKQIAVHPIALSFADLPTEVYGKETVTFKLENRTNKKVEIGKVKIRFERATSATQAVVTGKGPSGYLDLTGRTDIAAGSSSGPVMSGDISFELDSQGEDTSFEFTLIYDGDTLETKQIAVHPIKIEITNMIRYAKDQGKLWLAHILDRLQKGEVVDVNQKDDATFYNTNQTALYQAVVINDYDAVEWLLRKGADPNVAISNKGLTTTIALKKEERRVRIANIWVKKMNKENLEKAQIKLLHDAIWFGYITIVQGFLEKSVELGKMSYQDNTPLHRAVLGVVSVRVGKQLSDAQKKILNAYKKIIKLLLNAGQKADNPNKANLTPLKIIQGITPANTEYAKALDEIKYLLTNNTNP